MTEVFSEAALQDGLPLGLLIILAVGCVACLAVAYWILRK
jgi:hypothetical protein